MNSFKCEHSTQASQLAGKLPGTVHGGAGQGVCQLKLCLYTLKCAFHIGTCVMKNLLFSTQLFKNIKAILVLQAGGWGFVLWA